VTAAQIGAATGSPLYEFTEVDPAYATGAVQIAGATMTGGLTNEFGYFGNGAGLTNLAATGSASNWSGYAATQQVVWYEGADTWRAGYDTNSTHWVISCNGTNIQEWRGTSNYDIVHTIIKGHLTVNQSIDVGGGIEADAGIYVPSITLNDVYRDTWPSEYSDTAIYGALNTVSNWTIAGSNLAATVAGNLSVVSNQAAAGSNLAFDVGGNLSIVSNQAAAGSNLAYGLSGNLSVVSNQVAGASNLAWAIGAGGSNYADSVGAAVGLVATNLSAGAGLVASNALSRSDGGAVTGNVTIAGSGDLTATNLYLPRFGTVYFGTTNYIRDQGSNLLFHFNTNEAIFNW
jgi:hypothetical protein